MRWSQAFIPTLRDDPNDAEAVSHKLLVRAGFIRQLMAGVYTILPLGHRVRAKIRAVIKEEIDGIGGQEFLLPSLHPAELWQKSGRWDVMGDEMFRIKDRKGGELALGMTHEEVFTTLALELTSYKQLPQLWYQIHTKFRDEPRPKSGVLRVREFTMKDSYSFDIDEAGLDAAFDEHFKAYLRIFHRIGLADVIPVEASSGAMGGSGSVEFMVRSDAGEDFVAHCGECGYAANIERATAALPPAHDEPGPETPEKFPTPGVRTIADLAAFDGGAVADRQIKSLVYSLDGDLVIALMRGDHDLNQQKLQDATGAIDIRPADGEEIQELLGADAGSLGAVGLSGVKVLADHALTGRTSMTTGANENDFHLRGVSVDRDITVTEWHDLREVRAGEPCIECGSALDVFKTIEAGHIFKLGSKYAEALGATVLDENGKSQTLVMGSYGIGLERNMAAVVETHHDDKGVVWPMSVAPYEVVITVVKIDDPETVTVSEELYRNLMAAGVDVIIDDRKERPGVKFNDAELIGIPIRITVGPRGLADGVVEVAYRSSGASETMSVAETADRIVATVIAERSLTDS